MKIRLHTLRALHTVAVATSAFAIQFNLRRLWEFAGGVECWCDEQIYALRPEQERGVPDKGWLMVDPDPESIHLFANFEPSTSVLFDEFTPVDYGARNALHALLEEEHENA